MRNASRFIPGEEIEAVPRWGFGAADSSALEAFERAQSNAAVQACDEVMRQQAYTDIRNMQV
ncbi:MAG: hypothetical protein ABIN37_13310 [Burkholderiaceae bacterium]